MKSREVIGIVLVTKNNISKKTFRTLCQTIDSNAHEKDVNVILRIV
jgi:hypothetical protein